MNDVISPFSFSGDFISLKCMQNQVFFFLFILIRYLREMILDSQLVPTLFQIKGFYRGATSSFAGMALEGSLFFGIYSQTKQYLQVCIKMT
jgi:hypothetical protein